MWSHCNPPHLVDLTEATLANEVEEEVARVEGRVGVEPGGLLCRQPLQLTDVQAPLPLKLLQFQLKSGILLGVMSYYIILHHKGMLIHNDIVQHIEGDIYYIMSHHTQSPARGDTPS